MDDYLKFGYIILCFIISISYAKRCANIKDAILLRLAMFFTVLADYSFLIIYNNTLGVGLFCIVQITYIYRYGGKKAPLLPMALIAALFPIGIYAAANPLYAFAAVYAMCFCFSLYYVVKSYKHSALPYANRLLSLLGMVLFAFCDINVALYNITRTTEPYYTLIWICYLPSQMLLAVSAYRYTPKA